MTIINVWFRLSASSIIPNIALRTEYPLLFIHAFASGFLPYYKIIPFPVCSSQLRASHCWYCIYVASIFKVVL